MSLTDYIQVPLVTPNNDVRVGILAWQCPQSYADAHNGGTRMDLIVVLTQQKILYQDWATNCWREWGTHTEAKVISAKEAGYVYDKALEDTVWWDHRAPK